MKTKIFLAVMASALLFSSCNNEGKLDVSEGSGTIQYDGKTYQLNIASVITSGPDDDGLYTHHVSLLGTGTGDFFIF